MLLAFRLWIGKTLFGAIGAPGWPVGIKVSPSRFIKWSRNMAEVEAMAFVAEHTSIPIPKVYRTHLHRGRIGIEMEWIKHADCISHCWKNLTDAERDNITTQLASYVTELRSLQPPKNKRTVVSSASGGPCWELRLGNHPCGPFTTMDEFHTCVRGGMRLTEETFGPLVVDVHSRHYGTRFTHGDLSIENILVRDGKIVAIIDWECAGWYPEYWEYTRAFYNRYNFPDFYRMIAEKLTPYEDELTAERTLWRLLDAPLDQR
ncbi:unnamed protein product [Zymoseptoria tritici ST99CH_1A5]|uniref:non-specific serine/threonine protein kinase n=4 Tax=Zymoseptoria tritici TaxID=1047171 RepID=A0A1X7RV49_ZYMT9|nr:unnamed protein product [Zymoseptoria tritici ST99CH_3D7]SMR53243.1 unnamed protein product [Zymoseptoria tritici ST99CH_1E4]SMR54910.1 unnamed protein product [Zymoseptoria tritici ST99CH_3D1]SMY24983.1 unnamed protein product [Zymoseptoria tritici ST99CH_1A5]